MIVQDPEVYRRFKTLCTELGVSVTDMLWNFVSKKVVEFDGQKNGIERFFDANFIPKPEIDDDFEKKVLPYLRTLNDESLDNLLRTFYQGYIHIKALQDTPPDQRRTVEFVYDSIWRKYR